MSAPAGKPRGGHRGPQIGIGAGEETLDFKRSARRLVGLLRPYRLAMVVVLALTGISVALAVVGPRECTCWAAADGELGSRCQRRHEIGRREWVRRLFT